MKRNKFKLAAKEKLGEWFDPRNEKYKQRQKLIEEREELRKYLKKNIHFYSYSSFGDEVMGNIKALIILIFIISGVVPIFFM